MAQIFPLTEGELLLQWTFAIYHIPNELTQKSRVTLIGRKILRIMPVENVFFEEQWRL